MFLYEYNEDYETVDRPRHCVPYAFVVYNKSKDAKSSGDTKPMQWTSKPKPQTISRQPSSGNEAIRKSNREAFEKRVAGLYQAPQFPHLYIPPVESWMPAKTGLLPLPVRPPGYSVTQTRQDRSKFVRLIYHSKPLLDRHKLGASHTRQWNQV